MVVPTDVGLPLVSLEFLVRFSISFSNSLTIFYWVAALRPTGRGVVG